MKIDWESVQCRTHGKWLVLVQQVKLINHLLMALAPTLCLLCPECYYGNSVVVYQIRKIPAASDLVGNQGAKNKREQTGPKVTKWQHPLGKRWCMVPFVPFGHVCLQTFQVSKTIGFFPIAH